MTEQGVERWAGRRASLPSLVLVVCSLASMCGQMAVVHHARNTGSCRYTFFNPPERHGLSRVRRAAARGRGSDRVDDRAAGVAAWGGGHTLRAITTPIPTAQI